MLKKTQALTVKLQLKPTYIKALLKQASLLLT